MFRVDDSGRDARAVPAGARGHRRGCRGSQMEADGLDLGPHGLLVESFLDGARAPDRGLAWDDEVYLGSIVDRITVEGDTFDDDVHHAPTVARPPSSSPPCTRVVAAGAHAQGLRRSVMHAEVRFHQGRPHMLEIAVRPGGGGLDHIARLDRRLRPDPGHDGRRPRRAARTCATTGRPASTQPRMCLISGAGHDRADRPCPTRWPSPTGCSSSRSPPSPGDVIRRPPDGNNILGFLGTTGTSLDDAMRRRPTRRADPRSSSPDRVESHSTAAGQEHPRRRHVQRRHLPEDNGA